jgi:hypothetical protein
LLWSKDQQTIPGKAQLVNNLGFVGQSVSTVTVQLHHTGWEEALDNKLATRYGYAPIKVYLQKQSTAGPGQQAFVCQSLL